MDSLKVEADALISEIENNADLDYSTLFKYQVDLLGLNLAVEAKNNFIIGSPNGIYPLIEKTTLQ